MRNRTALPTRQTGVSLVEVLVTVVIVAIGLLGLAGMQSRLQASDMESYQRAQALLLLDDMAARLTSNRAAAADYVTGSTAALGVGMTCPTTGSTSSRAELDAADWCHQLQGAAEEITGGARAGAMIGARGCVEQLPNSDYLVTVVWQGLLPLTSPPASVTCGVGAYDSGATCTADRCRRTVTTVIHIASLT
jgi:type IV pilus assembly protein PilV